MKDLEIARPEATVDSPQHLRSAVNTREDCSVRYHGRPSGQRFGAETLKRYKNLYENNIELIAFQIRTAETLFRYSVSAPACIYTAGLIIEAV